MATTRRTLLGALSGLAVSIAVAQGGHEASNTIAAWGEAVSPGTSITIETRRGNLQIAPEGIWLRAVPSGFDVEPSEALDGYCPAFGRISYTWKRWKQGASYAPEPYARTLRNPDFINNKHLRLGQWVHFVCDDPGAWVYEVTAIDESGHMNSASVTLETGDPDAFFDATHTIVCASDGDFTGAPAHGNTSNECATWSAVIARAVALAAPVRVLFKGGDSFAWSSVRGDYAPINSMYFGKWGSGTATLSGAVLFHIHANNLDFTWRDLKITTGYDAATETGDARAKAIATNSVQPGQRYVFHNVEWENVGSAFDASDSIAVGVRTEGASYCFSECKVSNTGVYPLFCQERRAWIGLSGCDLKDTPGRSQNSALDGGWTMRSSGRIINVSGCDLFTYRGWSRNGAALTPQPAFRFNNGGDEGMHVIVESNFSEGSFFTGGALQNPGFVNPVLRALAERNIIIGIGGNMVPLMSSRSGGQYFRNNHLVFPNAFAQQTPPTGGNGFMPGDMIESRALANNTTAASAAHGEIKRNTLIYLRNVSYATPTILVDGTLPNVDVADNIIHAPNLTNFPAVTSYGPFDVLDMADVFGVELLYEGYWIADGAGLNSNNKPTHALPYSSETTSIAASVTVVGATSGATGYVLVKSASGSSGTLYLRSVIGTFQSGEALNISGGAAGVATAGTTQALPDVTQRIDLYLETGSIAVGETITGENGGTATVVIRTGSAIYIEETGGQLYSFETITSPGGSAVITDTAYSRLPCPLIPGTITPTHELDYSGATGAFEEGETITGGTSDATATLTRHQSTESRMMLRYVTGEFADGETLTGSASGAMATADGPSRRHGAEFLYVPTGDFTGGGVVGAAAAVAWTEPGEAGALREAV